jgi:hypothetical protein
MIDRRDFDEWWEREVRRNGRDSGPDYRAWAEAGFLAAAHLMASAIRTQKLVAKQAQKPAALLMRDMLKAADK